MRGNEFTELAAFATVAEHRSFARAASSLRISPSTLSQSIRTLEQRLGVQLLNRTTRSVSVTEAGARLLARLVPAVTELEAAVDEARSTPSSPAGTIRVQLPWPAFYTVLEPFLGPFYQAHPSIVLDLTLEDAPTDIVAGGFDIGIRLGELVEQDLIAIPLGGGVRQVAVASPDYVAEHGLPQTPDELLHHRCINWRWPGHTGLYNWEFMRDRSWFSVAVNGPLIVSHRDAALRAALQGIGIAYWNEKLVQPYVTEGKLVTMLEVFSPPFPGWHLMYPRQRHLPTPVRAFVDFMRRRARDLT
jgi:DNA-binding transcriptional LysR family regulator